MLKAAQRALSRERRAQDSGCSRCRIDRARCERRDLVIALAAAAARVAVGLRDARRRVRARRAPCRSRAARPLAGARPNRRIGSAKAAARARSNGSSAAIAPTCRFAVRSASAACDLKMQGDGRESAAAACKPATAQTLESDAAWDELEARLGASVPAGNLRYWMLGLAAPGRASMASTRMPRASRLSSRKAGASTTSAIRTTPVRKLPMRMRATSGDARVRIVIDRWQLGQ